MARLRYTDIEADYAPWHPTLTFEYAPPQSPAASPSTLEELRVKRNVLWRRLDKITANTSGNTHYWSATAEWTVAALAYYEYWVNGK